ncbi:PREDICTED: peroxidase 27-like [Erythranthe guttata]|uniref:peroxidase 27-like n=1 Tax=Erythranthe guttata TaxID=4155 RepID=UPI00064E0B31|nr:PREDICTED: peroxidase 27-like [Erythranthe guttata]|eukprot:XP_012852352.1 PREDICTED: peroxidase 27-like [Erythranthe guttata]
MAFTYKHVIFNVLVLLSIFNTCHTEELKFGFYKNTCPSAEAIVKQETSRIISVAPSLAAAFLRMHFHDCFVRTLSRKLYTCLQGCDGSVLLDSTRNNKAEKDSFPNLSLRGFGSIARVKSTVEKQCPGVVSCADILALLARDAISDKHGAFWPVRLGRRDGRVSKSSEVLANLPAPNFNISQLKASFASKGFTTKDLVVLSETLSYLNMHVGAHTIGVSHCSSFSNRLYNFTGKGDSDPALESNYTAFLMRRCKRMDVGSLVEMDPRSYKVFDTSYYKAVANKKGLFTSDSSLLADGETRAYVTRHAATPDRGLKSFFGDFAKSMVKMSEIGVLTGNRGEIRKTCSFVN